MTETLTMDSPLGLLHLVASEGAIIAVQWGPGARDDNGREDALLAEAMAQLSDYFAGAREGFDLPLAPGGSQFQRNVCAAMSAIPFGHTRSYGDLAAELGAPAQAIGRACGGNPIPIIIPCHRVLGANGLGGFSARGGVESKVWLLKHEGAASLLI